MSKDTDQKEREDNAPRVPVPIKTPYLILHPKREDWPADDDLWEPTLP